MLFKPNIDRKGRIARAITGLLTISVGGIVWFLGWPESGVWRAILAGALVAAGGFQLFEARRSWCVMRACGVRTPM